MQTFISNALMLYFSPAFVPFHQFLTFFSLLKTIEQLMNTQNTTNNQKKTATHQKLLFLCVKMNFWWITKVKKGFLCNPVNFVSSTGLVPHVSSYTEYLFIYLTDVVYQRKNSSDALHSVLLAKEKESNAQW